MGFSNPSISQSFFGSGLPGLSIWNKNTRAYVDELAKSRKLGDTVKSSRCTEKRANGWPSVSDRLILFFVCFVVAMKLSVADGLFTSRQNLNNYEGSQA